MKEFRCDKCHKLLAKYLECQELSIKCPRCGKLNALLQRISSPKLFPGVKA